MPKPSPLDIIKQQVKNEYQTTPAKSKELSLRYNIKDSTIRSWISREKWLKLKIGQTNIDEIMDVPKSEITDKERFFCLYYTRNPVAGTAARRAGFSDKCAYEIGYQLLQKPAIREEIKRLKKIKYESIMLEVEDIVEKHMRIAFSDITDYLDFGRVEVPVMGPFGPIKLKETITDPDTGKKKKVERVLTRVVNDVRFHESSDVDGGVISEVKIGRDGASIKLHDAQKSMDWLDKYFEWNPMDKHKKEYDRKRLELAQKELELKEKDLNSRNW